MNTELFDKRWKESVTITIILETNLVRKMPKNCLKCPKCFVLIMFNNRFLPFIEAIMLERYL